MIRIPIALSALAFLIYAPLVPVSDGRDVGPGAADLTVLTLDGEKVAISSALLVNQEKGSALVRGRSKGMPWSRELANIWKLEFASGAAADYDRAKVKAWFQVRGGSTLEGKLVGGDPADANWLRFEMPGAILGGKEGLVRRQHLLALRVQPLRKPKPVAADKDAPATTDKGKADELKKEPGKLQVQDGGFARALASPPENRDLIFVEDKKKRVRSYGCDVRGVDDKGVSIDFRGQVRSLPLSRIYGIVFGNLSGIAPEFRNAGEVAVEISLTDTRRFRGKLLAMDQGHCTLGLASKLVVRFPRRSIKEAVVFSDRYVYISDLEIKDKIQKSMLGREWPILNNHSGGGRPLRLGKDDYRKGFLLVPDVSFRVDLPRPYSRLLGRVGMPKAMVGSAVLRFLVDGEQVGQDYKLQADGKLQDIDLDLKGAKELSLELEHSVDLDAGARVILGDLRAINTQ